MISVLFPLNKFRLAQFVTPVGLRSNGAGAERISFINKSNMLQLFQTFFSFFAEVDTHLAVFATEYGAWIYGILFLIIFFETGLVVTPFLPGDSLLFAAGALAALGSLNIFWLFAALSVAAVVGDTVNYLIGRHIGPKIFQRDDVRFLNKAYLMRAEQFFERHGKKTIIMARFMPIIRTFAPFVAGIGKMHYPVFIAYNVIGGIAWVGICLGAGYLFGNVPIVQENFTLVILGIIFVSLLPGVIEFVRHHKKNNKQNSLPS